MPATFTKPADTIVESSPHLLKKTANDVATVNLLRRFLETHRALDSFK